MSGTHKVIDATCPICGESKSLSVPEAIFAQKKFGTIKIQVPVNAVCPEHQFIVFVDSKGIIRGYEKIDIQMAVITETEETALEAAGVLTLRKLIQIFGLYGIFSLIHSRVFNYPSYIIVDEDFELNEDVMNDIGDNLMPERYKGSKLINIIEETDYSKIKLKDKNALLMDTHQHILQTPWQEKLKFEEAMLKKALEIFDEREQLVLIQQQIAKLIKEAEYSKGVLEDVKEIYEDDLIEQITRELMIPKLTHYRLMLIKNFIKQRFSPKLAQRIRNKVEQFLDLL